LNATKKHWLSVEHLVSDFKRRAQAPMDRFAILSSVWDKECGAYTKYWTLIAVKKGVLYVRPKSSAAAQELHMRSMVLIKSLNKYFSRPWITSVQTIYR
jgi:hypothetical protein